MVCFEFPFGDPGNGLKVLRLWVIKNLCSLLLVLTFGDGRVYEAIRSLYTGSMFGGNHLYRYPIMVPFQISLFVGGMRIKCGCVGYKSVTWLVIVAVDS